MLSTTRPFPLTCFGICFAVLMLGSSVVVPAQQKPAATSGVEKAKLPFILKVKKGPIISLSLQAKETKLNDITVELSKRLKIPVSVTPLLQAQLVSLDFKDLALEPALQLLSPQVFIDYQVDANGQTPIGIFFSGYNEQEPSTNAVVQGNSQAMLVEGDTEDGVEPATEEAKKKLEDKPLKIVYGNKSLSIRARDVPLTFVTLRVGEELGVPVEIKDDTKDVITTEIVGLPPEEAIHRLSPNIRMYVRADLQGMERRLLRLVLMPPPNSNQNPAAQP